MRNTSSRPLGSMAALALALTVSLPAPPARAQITDPAGATNQVLTLMNQQRAANGAAALVRQCDLDTAAARHVNDMAAHNSLSHTGSDGSTAAQRVAATGYPVTYVGENIAFYYATPEAVMSAWMSSPGHRDNILSANFKEVGIAVGGTANYWCVVFGGGGGRQCAPATPGTTPGASDGARPLGGTVTTLAAVADSRQRRLFVFGQGTDGALWYRARQAGSTAWDDWQSLGGAIRGNIAAGFFGGAAPAAFVRGTDGAVWYRARVAGGVDAATGAVTDVFGNWSSLGGVLTSDPVIALNADGRTAVFARGTDNALWHNWQTTPTDGNWAGWQSLEGSLPGTPAVGANQDGRLSIFHRGNDGGLWVRTQVGAGTSATWTDWAEPGGGLAADPVVIQLADGRLAAFYRTLNNTLAARCQTAPNAATWAAEVSLDTPSSGITGSPTVVLDRNGRVEVFIRDAGRVICRRGSLTTDPGSGWGAWSSVQFASPADPVSFREPGSGSPSLIALDAQGAVWELPPLKLGLN